MKKVDPIANSKAGIWFPAFRHQLRGRASAGHAFEKHPIPGEQMGRHGIAPFYRGFRMKLIEAIAEDNRLYYPVAFALVVLMFSLIL
ncbi:hypothetical protein ASC80_05400 [Afipia sp. Root123D2]|uniref:hypothetical protein n=1 Tax=Afipia sp. Root123D2 TaxID=1736436 RepID=UPI0006FBF081|nr:hypothetical protein [Afipia sp. Root123D2]KQW22779.1 hypothetical protein ASC80_05400 [Afipia sp. Root123D2]